VNFGCQRSQVHDDDSFVGFDVSDNQAVDRVVFFGRVVWEEMGEGSRGPATLLAETSIAGMTMLLICRDEAMR
jgi:hypothetical protein